ncbi:MAG: dynamin family protein [Anaerovibrio sp.]|nr:dynamin family protein [Anaerovibrio sp.]
MSITFTKTKEKERAFTAMNERFDAVLNAVKPYADETTLSEISGLKNNFNRRIEDFFSNDRKLRLAVIGRVKAGKSTFLNMLIFDGKDVLPRAFTPKTATLTKIEYAPENAIEVEYYSTAEWESLEELAKSDSAAEEVVAAKELIEAVKKSGIDYTVYTQKRKERLTFSSNEALMDTLNRYVGENGAITPFVKSVVLYINRPELEGISIVDTPGLNDPVQSRTQRTKEFLEVCDTAFFLSTASHFLDKSDVDLLKAQLPQKGVVKLALICSRFDEGLSDELFNYDTLEENIVETKKQLTKEAKSKFSKEKERYIELGENVRANLMEACENPMFISSLYHNMVGREYDDYDELEQHAYDLLNDRDELNPETVAQIGDIAPVEEYLNEVIAKRDAFLAERADEIVPSAEKSLNDYLGSLHDRMEKHLDTLANNDRENLEKQRRDMQGTIHNVQAKVEEYFGTMSVKMDEAKIAILRDLRRSSHEHSQLQDKTGTETKFIKTRVSDSTWYKPWTWGSSHTEVSSYQTTYTYVDTSDALERVRHYASEASSSIEQGFVETTDVQSLKQHLLKVVVDNFDASNENYDPAYFRLLTEGTLNKIDMPVMKIDVEDYLSVLNAQFSGEIRDSSKRSELRSLLASSISKLFDAISDQFTQEVARFKGELDKIKDGFSEELLKDINADFEAILKECENKEASIARLKEYVAILGKL